MHPGSVAANTGMGEGCSLSARLRARGSPWAPRVCSRSETLLGFWPSGVALWQQQGHSLSLQLRTKASLVLLQCCKMKFGAVQFCFQLLERKPEGWKPNEAKANKAFSMNIFTSSEGAEGSISCIPDNGVPSSTDNYGVGAS